VEPAAADAGALAVIVPDAVEPPRAEATSQPAGPPAPPGMALLAPGGVTFVMGRDGATPAEGPAHEVRVEPFFLDQTEVTREAYGRCVQVGACTAARDRGDDASAGRGAWPVTGVAYADAETYCRWRGARLPTEAEFEFAVRGAEGRLYPWGNVWRDGCSNSKVGDSGNPRAVGTSGACGATPDGVADLLGNVWEFVSGAAEPYPGGAPLDHGGTDKVLIRGHSYFNTDPKELVGSFRMWVGRGLRGPWLGFRCAADAH
jgi:formylglycine-generating enzyme required for sulfatase activity